jgi:hypothetical protein
MIAGKCSTAMRAGRLSLGARRGALVWRGQAYTDAHWRTRTTISRWLERPTKDALRAMSGEAWGIEEYKLNAPDDQTPASITMLLFR